MTTLHQIICCYRQTLPQVSLVLPKSVLPVTNIDDIYSFITYLEQRIVPKILITNKTLFCMFRQKVIILV